MVAGGSHIDHADVLRSGATGRVLGHRVMAPSTLGTFLRAFTFGHVRQLDKVIGEVIARAWKLGAGPGASRLVSDIDSTICEVHGRPSRAPRMVIPRSLVIDPLIATRADTGEVLSARMRKGSANTARGAGRFVTEVIGRVRACGAGSLFALSQVRRRHARRSKAFWPPQRLGRHMGIVTIPSHESTPGGIRLSMDTTA